MQIRAVVASIVIAVSGNVAVQAGKHAYPNELPGYQLQANAPWSALRPLQTTAEEAEALLGRPEAVFRDDGPGWKYLVHYWAAGGSCDGRPFPSILSGRVWNIEVVPKFRISFLNIHFPKAFRQFYVATAHHPVGSWDVYADEDGLEYHVYNKSSDDGEIAAGDLKAIIYGPSRRLNNKLTRCPEAWF